MSGCWLICCCDGAYAWARREIAARDERAVVVRAELGEFKAAAKRLAAAPLSLMLVVCGGEEARAVACGLCELGGAGSFDICVVRVEDPGSEDVQKLLAAGATEVIAVGGNGEGCCNDGPAAAYEAHRENACDCQAACTMPSACDDLTPIDELWPPLDEPDDEALCTPGSIALGEDPNFDIEAEAPLSESVSTEGTQSFPALSNEGAPPAGPPAAAPKRLEVTMAAAREHAAQAGIGGPRAPLVTVISGRGGTGKTMLVASMATAAARAGLRAAVLDLDLMFGDLPALLGVDAPKGLEMLVDHEVGDELVERDIEGSAMRVGPGLTLWGPLSHAERAEFYGAPVERLIGMLRDAADVIFADTSGFWGDAVAVAVALCDRCLVVGSGCETAGESATRAVALASRLGVPATRMTSVFNRFGAPGCGEEDAMRFEMGASLHSRMRIADGGRDVASMVSFGHLDALVSGNGPFAASVRSCTAELLGELGCRFDSRLMEAAQPQEEAHAKFRLPWQRGSGDGS